MTWRDSYEIQPAIGRPLMWTPMLTTYPEADHVDVMKVHAEGRAAGADVRPQVTCLPLKVQLRMDNPYYFRTVPIFLELLGRDPSEFPAFYGDPAWRAEATRQVPAVKPPVDWHKFFVAETTTHLELLGRDVASIARERRCSEIDVLCDLSLDDHLGTRFLVILSNDEDGPVTDLMTQPGAVFGQSDAGAHVAQLCDANMPTELLAHWVREGNAHARARRVQTHGRARRSVRVGRSRPVGPGVGRRRGRLRPGPDRPGPAAPGAGPARRRGTTGRRRPPGHRPRARQWHDHHRQGGVAGRLDAGAAREDPPCTGRPSVRAVVCHGPGEVRVEDIDDPTPRSGEVKVEVHAVGVCHTDLNFTTGQVPVPYPIVLGHEAAGVVVEAGPGRHRRRGRGPRGVLHHRPLRALLPVPPRRPRPV